MVAQQEKQESRGELLLTADEGAAGSKWLKIGAALAAVALTAALLLGYVYLQRVQKGRLAQLQAPQQAPESLPPKAQIFQDEVRLKGGTALVSGTVKNISDGKLDDLSVEIELKRRQSQEVETRPVRVEPDDLNPGQSGKYSLQIPSTGWAGVRVAKLRSGEGGAELAFKPELGERRPAERPPQGKTTAVQKPRRKGDDFLNTPDTPVRIP